MLGDIEEWEELDLANAKLKKATDIAEELEKVVKLVEEQKQDEELWATSRDYTAQYIQEKLKIIHKAIDGVWEIV